MRTLEALYYHFDSNSTFITTDLTPNA